MIAIPIKSKTHGEHLFFIDSDDYNLITKYKWSFVKSGNRLYVTRGKYNPDNKKIKAIKLHRLITNCPDGMEVDHIDGNTLNNCRSNLRICSQKENCRNRIKSSKIKSSIYKGVYLNKPTNKYLASIKFDKKVIHLGLFKSQEEAAMEYNKAALKYHGEFAKINIIEA